MHIALKKIVVSLIEVKMCLKMLKNKVIMPISIALRIKYPFYKKETLKKTTIFSRDIFT